MGRVLRWIGNVLVPLLVLEGWHAYDRGPLAVLCAVSCVLAREVLGVLVQGQGVEQVSFDFVAIIWTDY